jgi:hypothetical protein
MYSDEALLAGVGAAHTLSQVPVVTLLREYGRYFIINGLTGHLCSHILSNVFSGCDLLLTMRDAHARLRRTKDELQPPLFKYTSVSPNKVTLIYDSPRQLCSVLLGAIEGAAQRYGETVQIEELSCMKHGDATCQIRTHFSPPKYDPARYTNTRLPEQREERTRLLKQLWNLLPEAGTIDGFTLTKIQDMLKKQQRLPDLQIRPAVLFEALQQLQFSGYVMSTSTRENDDFMKRRYWRVHRHM